MLAIETLCITDFQQNAKIVFDSESKEAAVIDPGGEVERIWAVIEAKGLNLRQIILTHAHLDHAGGVEALRRKAGVADIPIFGHEIEAPMRAAIAAQASMYGFSPSQFENVDSPVLPIACDAENSVEFDIAGFTSTALFTPGHSPGHVSFFFPAQKVMLYSDSAQSEVQQPILIAGDALFAGSIGRTDLPGGDHEVLINSIKTKLLTLPGETRVLAGHGPDTQIDVESKTNPFF